MTTTTIRGAAGHIAARREFRAGNLRGTTTFDGMGRLHRAYDALAVAHADYLVYSYATPIAWHVGGSWVIPFESYSATTTRHQNLVRSATR